MASKKLTEGGFNDEIVATLKREAGMKGGIFMTTGELVTSLFNNGVIFGAEEFISAMNSLIIRKEVRFHSLRLENSKIEATIAYPSDFHY